MNDKINPHLRALNAILNEARDRDLKKVEYVIFRAMHHASTLGVKMFGVYLRNNSLCDYEIMIIVDEDSFCRDDFHGIYTALHEIEETQRSPTFHLFIHFMPVNPGDLGVVNMSELQGDGYDWHLAISDQGAPMGFAEYAWPDSIPGPALVHYPVKPSLAQSPPP